MRAPPSHISIAPPPHLSITPQLSIPGLLHAGTLTDSPFHPPPTPPFLSHLPPTGWLGLEQFHDIAVAACGLPSAAASPLYASALRYAKKSRGSSGDDGDGDGREDGVGLAEFTTYWQSLPTDPVEQFMSILSLRDHESDAADVDVDVDVGSGAGAGEGGIPFPSRQYLELEDFRLMVESVLQTHPGLAFLVDSPEFGERYVQTVLYRIMYTVNISRTDQVTAKEIRRSNLLAVLHKLDVEDDINKVTDYFSYRHFYVIYTSFWKLDIDRDMFITRTEL
jgi:hypothetical protein